MAEQGECCRKSTGMNTTSLWTVLVMFRFLLATITRTTFVPDEYYQVVEPAYQIVYSVGIQTWEWADVHQIRSFVPLTPFIIFYRLCKLLQINNIVILTIAPRLLQTTLSVVSDFSLFELSRLVVCNEAAYFVVAAHCLSWSAAYCMGRTLANSTEASLVIIGTHMLLRSRRYKAKSTPQQATWSTYLAVAIAAVSAYSRPTSLLFWAPLYLLELWHSPDRWSFLVTQCVPVGITVLQACTLVDSYHYGNPTLPPLNFYVANISHRYAALFGVHAWHWNFSQGLPVMLGLYMPLLLFGWLLRVRFPPLMRDLSVIALIYACGLSFVSPHQEYRFLLPCLPFLHMLVGVTAHQLWRRSTATDSKVSAVPFARVLSVTVCVHVAAVLYLTRHHQSAAEAALIFVAQDLHQHRLQRHQQHSESTDVFLAAPCYSFPGYAFIHTETSPVRLWMPACEPGEASKYFDSDPVHFLGKIVQESSVGERDLHMPSYLLTFDSYLAAVTPHLVAHNYTEIYKIRHAHFQYDFDDPFPKQFVHIFRLNLG